MKLRYATLLRTAAVIAISIGPASAQNATSDNGPPQSGNAIKPQDTGVGPRGTEVAPSTSPAEAGNAFKPSDTGVLPRGTPVSESTPPPASGNGTTAKQ